MTVAKDEVEPYVILALDALCTELGYMPHELPTGVHGLLRTFAVAVYQHGVNHAHTRDTGRFRTLKAFPAPPPEEPDDVP